MRNAMRLGALVIAAALVSSHASADPLALTGGTLNLFVMGNVGGRVAVEGDRGFSFVGSMFGGMEAPVGDPLPPGTTVTLRGGATGLDVRGTATLDGITYTDVGGPDSPSGASIFFATTAMLPAVLEAPATISAPFAMNFLFWPNSNPDPLRFSGTGTATVSLGIDQGLGARPDGWLVTAIDANLSSPAPVPEPATVLLLGGGLAGLGLTRLRSTRRPR